MCNREYNSLIYLSAISVEPILKIIIVFQLVLAITASGPNESSYAAYCYADGTCLGDLFSVMWMEELEKVCILVNLVFNW